MKNISIQIKVVAGIILFLAVSVGFSLFISVTNQRNNLLDSTRRNLITNNNMLNTLVRNMMLDGEAPLVVTTLTELKELPGFTELEIYRRDGNIAFSDFTTLEEVNMRQDMFAFEETPRVKVKQIEAEPFAAAIESNTPKTVENFDMQRMEYYFPILNYQQCRQCHGTDHFVRGVAYYQVSLERIFEQLGDARNTLILFFVLSGAAIAFLLIMIIRGLIIKPILSIGAVVTEVGGGNLEVQSDVRSSDELGMLSEKINSMISGLKEKNRLEIQNRVIEARNAENRKYLDNINEGLLLLNSDYTISNQYSSFVKELFLVDTVAGFPFTDLIYPKREEQKEDRSELTTFLKALFEKTATDMEMIMSINPLADKKLTIDRNGNRKEIVIDTDFQRIFGENGVENVMVIFEDKTDIMRIQRELERERERSETELEQIQAILKVGPQSFIDFEQDALNTLDHVEGSYSKQASGRIDEETVHKMMRDLHSLKGTARYLEFRRVADLAHAAEDVLSAVRKGERSWEDGAQEDIEESISEIRNELKNIDKINDTFKNFAVTLSAEDRNKAQLEDFLTNLKKMTEGIAEELEKDVEVSVSSELEELPHLSILRNPIIHVARNALDHGIEDEIERVSLGKPNTARIRFRLVKMDRQNKIIISDDGRGIDFDTVRKKAVERGLIKGDPSRYSEQDLLRFLFKPDFSTRNDVSDLSGRGVGLDVVRDEIKRLGGRISVYTKKGEGTRFTISVPEETIPEESAPEEIGT